jgi:hypothetical protein
MATRDATHPVREYASERVPGLLRLWLGVLVPPLAALANQEVTYAMVSWSCVERVHGTLHLVPLVALVIALAAGALGFREWRRLGSEWPSEGAGVVPRSRMLAVLGAASGAFFALLIIAQWLAAVFIEPCMRG